MTLYDIYPNAKKQSLMNCEITGVTDDTKSLVPGNVFVAIKGANFDGHDAAAEMLEKGASVVFTERDIGLSRQIIVDDTRRILPRLVSAFYGNPTRTLKLIAVTGTNGKSTIVAIIKHILESEGHKTGSIGTVGYDTCGKVYEAHLTTPRPTELYRYFREMADNGAEYCVIEASSQALAQSRFAEESFLVSVFTNLTRDHLDYHGTMENYFKAKKSLFDISKNAVICADDKYGQRLIEQLRIPAVTYSVHDTADYYSVNIKSGNAGVSYWLSSMREEKSFPVSFSMPGTFNVGNSLAAAAVCGILGINAETAVRELASCKGVRGRMEVLYHGEFTVICDYAHTEDALRKFLSTVKSFAAARIICVFGAAGERDSEKRPGMGEAVGELTDFAVVTSDNPRFENEEAIITQVVSGLKKTGTPYKAFTDRRAAIESALSEARKDDIVVLCGKGHEEYQVIGDEYRPFSERKIVESFVANID